MSAAAYGYVQHKPQLLSCTVLSCRTTAAPTLMPAVMGYALLLALMGSKYTPAWSHQGNWLGL